MYPSFRVPTVLDVLGLCLKVRGVNALVLADVASLLDITFGGGGGSGGSGGNGGGECGC